MRIITRRILRWGLLMALDSEAAKKFWLTLIAMNLPDSAAT
jgi:hypothetical protein